MLAALVFAAAVNQGDVSEVLFKSSRLNCRDWTEAANYYIGLGEEQAVASLLSPHKGSKADIRVGLICRILFQPKGRGPLRSPKFGDIALPTRSMPLSAWPEFPLFQQDGVWFELEENYRRGGKAESPSQYIEYCRKEGKFRTERLPVPTHEQASDALKALQGTKRWTSIQWSDGDLRSSYTYDRQWTVEMLRSQTRFQD